MPILQNGSYLKKNWLQANRGASVCVRTMTAASVVLLTVSLLAANCEGAEARVSREKINSKGRTHTVYLFVPDSLNPSTPAPLLILLHGSGRNGLSQVEQWKALAAREGIILAGPDATDPVAWRMPVDGPEFLRDLVEVLKAKYAVDDRRLYLFGHSAGAEFALRMGLLESEYFTAVSLHAGALNPDEYRIMDIATRKTPMTVFIGTRDPIFPLPLVRGTVTALNARGFATKLNEINGHDHNYYARSAEINRAVWEFLKQQKLDKAPQYTEYR